MVITLVHPHEVAHGRGSVALNIDLGVYDHVLVESLRGMGVLAEGLSDPLLALEWSREGGRRPPEHGVGHPTVRPFILISVVEGIPVRLHGLHDGALVLETPKAIHQAL
jgi:hypothetical protein